MTKFKTWEVLKELTEYNPNKYKGSNQQRFFMEVSDDEEPILCFLRPSCGSIEFRVFKVGDSDFVSDHPIIYPTHSWIEISKKSADIYLKGNYESL